jgi:amino acid permease
MSIIGGVGFLILGIWLGTTSSWRTEALLGFGFVLFIAVVATMLSTRWRPQSWKTER